MREFVTRVLVVLVVLIGLAGAWYVYLKMLGGIMERTWVKPSWVNVILLVGIPVLFGAIAGLLSRSWLIGLLFVTPLAVPLFFVAGFLIIWACEQWTIREMTRGQG